VLYISETFQLLEAIHLLKEVALIHCWGHKKALTLVQQGNNQVGQETKQATLQPPDVSLVSALPPFLPQEPVEEIYSNILPMTKRRCSDGRTETGRLVVDR
jgi:hypothetical protein